MATISAPYMTAWASLPMAILPLGMTTMDRSPATAAYAAAEAEVFPVEAQIMLVLPSSTALATAITIPRSLNEPVGFNPSNFKYSSTPNSWDRRLAGYSGVLPSNNVSRGVRSVTGKNSANVSIIPRHCANLISSFNPVAAADFPDDIQVFE